MADYARLLSDLKAQREGLTEELRELDEFISQA